MNTEPVNPYQSPADVDPHTWSLAPWLRRFLTACAAIMIVIVLADAWYMHRLKVDPTGRFVGMEPSEIMRTWVNDEVNPPE